MTDSATVVLAGEAIVCPECQSSEVRASQSSYPQDKQRAKEPGSFWRCGNCGARFFGPPRTDPPPIRHSLRSDASSSRHKKIRHGALDKEVQLGRQLKRWIFPLIVILLTVVAVVYLLDRRDAASVQFNDQE